jgi:hypothetical protein
VPVDVQAFPGEGALLWLEARRRRRRRRRMKHSLW